MMADTMIVNRLSRLLGERRMSVMELKRRTGLSYVTVHNLYSGKSNRVDFETLDKICDALDVTPGDILEYRREQAGGTDA
jgi:putative transcriptional regulator